MPNWTDNKVVIRGTAENVKRFMDDITTLEANPDDTPDEVYDLTSVNPVTDIYKNMHIGARDIDGVKCTGTQTAFVHTDGFCGELTSKYSDASTAVIKASAEL